MPLSKKDRNGLLLILVVIIFILLLIIWRMTVAFFPFQTKNSKQTNFFSEIINQIGGVGQNIKKEAGQLINQSELLLNQPASESADKQLTNEQFQQIENKILEHLNQTNQQNNP